MCVMRWLKGLRIKFADPSLEAMREKFAAQEQEKRFAPHQRQQINQGVQNVINRSKRPPQAIIDRHIAARALAERLSDDLDRDKARSDSMAGQAQANRGGGMHELPIGGLADNRQKPDVLLPDAVHDRVGDPQARQDQDVRRPSSSAGRSQVAREGDAISDVPPSEIGSIRIGGRDGIVWTPVRREKQSGNGVRVPVVHLSTQERYEQYTQQKKTRLAEENEAKAKIQNDKLAAEAEARHALLVAKQEAAVVVPATPVKTIEPVRKQPPKGNDIGR